MAGSDTSRRAVLYAVLGAVGLASVVGYRLGSADGSGRSESPEAGAGYGSAGYGTTRYGE